MGQGGFVQGTSDQFVNGSFTNLTYGYAPFVQTLATVISETNGHDIDMNIGLVPTISPKFYRYETAETMEGFYDIMVLLAYLFPCIAFL